MERFDSCFHPHHACDPHPNEYHENIHYTPDQINALLGLIPYKADRAEVPKMETLNDVNYIGHVATSEALPDKMEQPSWALVGSVKKQSRISTMLKDLFLKDIGPDGMI